MIEQAAPLYRWCDGADFAAAAADHVGALLARKSDAVLALPTGQTPVGMYAELVARSAAGLLNLDRARFFNLDDYVGLPPDHPLSYARYLRQHLLDPIGVRESQVRLLRGDAPDLNAECQAFEAAVAATGGLDLAILGLGANGHIGFNEPNADWQATTHIVSLTAETRATHRRQTEFHHPIPERGITMGIATIRSAKRIVLLVAGGTKRVALDALRSATPDPAWPVTSLLGHPYLTVISEAALRLPP